MFVSYDGVHQRIALAGLAVAMMLVLCGLAAGLEPSPRESLASHWALRLDMMDTLYEDVTVRARLVLTNTSGHSLQTELRTGGLGRLPEYGVGVRLWDSMGHAVPPRGVVGSWGTEWSGGRVPSAFGAGDSLCGWIDITSQCLERPIKPGRYVTRATFGFEEWRGNSWRLARLTSNPKTFVVAVPLDSEREVLTILRNARAAGGRRDAQPGDSAFGLLWTLLRLNPDSPYGPDAALVLRRTVGSRWAAASYSSSHERDSMRAELVALFPNDLLVDLYAYEAWRCTPRRNRAVVLRVWRRVPAGTRLARLLDAYHADLK